MKKPQVLNHSRFNEHFKDIVNAIYEIPVRKVNFQLQNKSIT